MLTHYLLFTLEVTYFHLSLLNLPNAAGNKLLQVCFPDSSRAEPGCWAGLQGLCAPGERGAPTMFHGCMLV